MILDLYLDTNSFEISTISDSLFNDRVYDLEITRQNAIMFKDVLFKNDDIYNVEFIENKKFCDWLYCPSETNKYEDEKKYLMKLIDQAHSVDDRNYKEIVAEIKCCKCNKRNALLCFMMEKCITLHITNYNELLLAHRYYIKYISNPDEFLNMVNSCYPKLYFHPDIRFTIKTLSAPINKCIYEIDRHLSALNDVFKVIFEMHKTEGLKKVLEIFSINNKITCSLEGDPASARKRLTYTFLNSEGNPIDVTCEPHTKLEGTGIPGDSRYRFDRIYFHPGIKEIEDNKLLIGYIGMHA